MTNRKILAILCAMTMLGTSAQASTTPQDVINQFQNQFSGDASQVSQWAADQLKYVIPFNSTSGNVTPSQIKIFPHFTVGVEGVVSGTELDNNALHSLNTQLINTKTIDSFSRLPFPMVLGVAKIGLPFGLDAGVRIGGIPKTSSTSGATKFSIQNSVFGIDVRKKVIEEGVTKPFGLTVGANYTHANGSLDVTNTYNSLTTPIVITSGGQTFKGALTGNGTASEHADWTTNSYGVQAILNKKILIFNPYVGASANYNTGNITNSITANGTAVITNPDGSTTTQGVNVGGSGASSANPWDLRALFGIDLTIFPFVRLGLGGEYAGSKNLAGNFGLRIQF